MYGKVEGGHTGLGVFGAAVPFAAAPTMLGYLSRSREVRVGCIDFKEKLG